MSSRNGPWACTATPVPAGRAGRIGALSGVLLARGRKQEKHGSGSFGLPPRVNFGSGPSLPFDRLDFEIENQIDDSRWFLDHSILLSRSCRRGPRGFSIEQHPAAVQLPRVIQISLASDSPCRGEHCYHSLTHCRGSFPRKWRSGNSIRARLGLVTGSGHRHVERPFRDLSLRSSHGSSRSE